MKAIVITGHQGSGKSTLAQTIAEPYYTRLASSVIFSESPVFHPCGLGITDNTKILVIDGMYSVEHIEQFINLISQRSIKYRMPYSMLARECSPLIIGVFQGEPSSSHFKGNKNIKHFNLK